MLLAIPALRALGAGGPVTLAAQSHIATLLHALGVVADHVAFDALGLDALFSEDAAREPRLPAAARVVSWFGARDPVFRRRLGLLAPDVVIAPSVEPGRLVWEHLLATLGAPAGEWCAPIEAPPAIRALGVAARVAAGGQGPPPWLVVHPGAGSPAKRWPAEAFARVVTALAARARLNVCVHVGPADADAAAGLRKHLGEGVAWLREPALEALAGVLADAALFVGNDSGVSHLAAALGVPSLVLFDSRHLDWRPWWRGAGVLTVTLSETVASEVDAVIAALEGKIR
ncbi:MAG TPA: glycosyltransferase family 9 protein [Methylomirabilota bacterium]